jgi:Zn-dependent peptidase ImmA (M78 family)
VVSTAFRTSQARTPEALLARYWREYRLPVDPMDIATSMGIGLIAEGSPDYELRGECYHEADGTPVIKYRTGDSPVGARFIVAHELRHLVLAHADAVRDPAASLSASTADRREVEANDFATALLMPAEWLDLLVRRGKDTPRISSPARKFGGSEVAMQYRLEERGWL